MPEILAPGRSRLDGSKFEASLGKPQTCPLKRGTCTGVTKDSEMKDLLQTYSQTEPLIVVPAKAV